MAQEAMLTNFSLPVGSVVFGGGPAIHNVMALGLQPAPAARLSQYSQTSIYEGFSHLKSLDIANSSLSLLCILIFGVPAGLQRHQFLTRLKLRSVDWFDITFFLDAVVKFPVSYLQRLHSGSLDKGKSSWQLNTKTT